MFGLSDFWLGAVAATIAILFGGTIARAVWGYVKSKGWV